MSRWRIRDRADGTYAVACTWDGPNGPRAGIRWQLKRPTPVTRAEARRMMGIARSYMGFMATSVVYVKVFGLVVRARTVGPMDLPYNGARGWSTEKHPVGRAEARRLLSRARTGSSFGREYTLLRVAL